MTITLILLSGLSLSVIWGSVTGFGHSFWIEQLIQNPIPISGLPQAHTPTLFLSITVVAIGILMAYLMYYRKSLNPDTLAQKFKGIYQTLTHLYWIDDLYEWAIIRNHLRLNTLLAMFDNDVIDQKIVDGWAPITVNTSTRSGDFDNYAIDQTLVDGTGKTIGQCGIEVRKIQTGHVQHYLLVGLGAFVISLVIYLLL